MFVEFEMKYVVFAYISCLVKVVLIKKRINENYQ